jgi:hypothetical protein
MRRTRLTGLLVKTEAVYGTDAVPSPATDGIQLEEHLYNQIEDDYLEQNEREGVTGRRMGRHGGAQPAGRFGKITAIVAVKGAGEAYAAGVRPEIDTLLRIAGHSAVVAGEAGSETLAYEPIDDNHESATVYAYSAGELFKLVGCQARITSGSLIAAQTGRITFEIFGQIVEHVSDAPLPAIVYPRRAVLPPVIKASALELNNVEPDFRSVTFNQNLELPARPRGNAPEGHAGYAIVDYDPQIVCQIDNPSKAVLDVRKLRHEAAEFPWSIRVGAQPYNRFTIAGPAGQVINTPNVEQDKLAMLDVTIRCHHGADAPAYSIVFD